MPSLRRVSLSLISGLLLPGCNRYELRPVPCPPEIPNGGSSIAWERTSDNVGTLVLSVRTIIDSVSLAPYGPQARIGSSSWRVFGTDGRIQFDSLAPGSHEVSVRALGYRAAHATVIMPEEGGLRAIATVALYPISFDGGCGMMYRARKPWWKLW